MTTAMAVALFNELEKQGQTPFISHPLIYALRFFDLERSGARIAP